MAKPNRLAQETSPYLQQHAHNPVDWYPWGTEALERARRENKPILLSIGYSACHWCHVMERESFSDENIAALMNRYFVNIKVDREERPDLDHIYQIAAQALTGHGGWPLTVFLTPDQRPFFAGTYFPPEDRYGRPGFRRVLETLHRVYTQDPERVEEAARGLVDVLRRVHTPPAGEKTVPDPDLLDQAATALMEYADRENGGFGTDPKFPSVQALEFLLCSWRRTGNQPYLNHVLLSLRNMARGGLYDQLGGGFHRYSVDARWQVPHFEKMLYDNALLPSLYVDAYRVTGDPLFQRVARETLAYVLREMTHPEGGFFSSQDADSEGEEGRFFVWTPEQVAQVLDSRTAELACRAFGITRGGNFEKGATVLSRRTPLQELAEEFRLPREDVEQLLEEARARLFAAREGRAKPFRDEKVLTGWNGLMISAFAKAAQVWGDEEYLQACRRALAFVDRYLVEGTGLRRSFKDRPGAIPGFAEDYVFLAQGLVDLYEAAFDPHHLRRAEALMEEALRRFWDPEHGGFFLTPEDHEPLIQRPKEGWDQSIPSANGIGAQVMLRLHGFTGDARWRQSAEKILALYGADMAKNPAGFGSLLVALDRYHSGVKEIVVVVGRGRGAEDGQGQAAGQELLRRIQGVFLPHRALAKIDGPADYPPLAAGKGTDKTAVYVCQDFHCEQPAYTWEELEPSLRG